VEKVADSQVLHVDKNGQLFRLVHPMDELLMRTLSYEPATSDDPVWLARQNEHKRRYNV
jgi:hypothetical protein